MIEGMTGFGRASVGTGAFRWTVEIRSLNHRFLDFSVRLPNTFSAWEADIQKLVQSRLKRGKITVSTSLANERANGERMVLDEAKLDFYVRTFKRIARKYHLQDGIGIREFVALPNLFAVEKKEVSGQYWQGLKKAVQEALEKLLKMRLAEGHALSKDLSGRIVKIRRAVNVIERSAKRSIVDYQTNLEKRIQSLDERIKIDPDRLAREVVMQAERSDITEEIVRARHHFDSFIKSLHSNEEAGKKLDFITQEIHREVNTITSKAQNFKISNEVVQIKSELEKIREQIQNIV